MEYAVKLNNAVTGFSVDNECFDCICGAKIIKADKSTGNILLETQLFKKEGLSRNLISDDNQLIIKDFYMLYILNKSDYSVIQSLKLGIDLSSDICGLTSDENYIYAAIRNGKIAVIDKKSFNTKVYEITDNSIWDIKNYQDYLISGTVGGKLLIIDKKEMKIKDIINLSKQNIGSISIHDNIVYTEGQDKKFCKIDLLESKIILQKRNAHKKMFDCIGIYGDNVLTVSYPCNEISFWDKNTLELIRTINMPLSLSGRTFIEKDILYITSRNIQGIALVCLN